MGVEDSSALKDRQVKLAQAQQLNFVLTAFGIVAALAFCLGGTALRWPSAIVLALLPAVLIYLVWREPALYAIARPKGDGRTDLILGFMACGLGLILGNEYIHFAGTEMLIECAALIGVLCCALIFPGARKNPHFWSAMSGTLLVAGLYGWGLTATADSMPDNSTPAHYTTTVLYRYESHHRGGVSYHLVLAPWGPIEVRKDLTVPEAMYDATLAGSQVCLEFYPGLLYLPWYRLVECDNSDRR